MFHVFTPVTNIELYHTQESLKSLDRQVREAAKEIINNQSEETKGE